MKHNYPYKSLIALNTDVHNQLLSVIESFEDKDLAYKTSHYDRTIGNIVSHTLNALEFYFIRNLALNEADALNYEDVAVKTITEAKAMITENLARTNELIKNFPEKDLDEVLTTDWGAEMTKEMAIWQGIMQIMLHLGEITLMAGMGGFYQGILG